MDFLRRFGTPGIPAGFPGIPNVPVFFLKIRRNGGISIPAPVPDVPCSGQEYFRCSGTSNIIPVEFLETLAGIPVQEFLDMATSYNLGHGN